MGPTTVMGADKAQGSKEKLIYGSELPRATTTRVSDEATQRMDFGAPGAPSRGPDLLKFHIWVKTAFLHTPMWAGI
jgi:hypothetical protein